MLLRSVVTDIPVKSTGLKEGERSQRLDEFDEPPSLYETVNNTLKISI